MQAASKSGSANVPVPMRTAIGARAIRPRATMRTASPGRKPNSARRRPNSAGAAASGAGTGTTRRRYTIIGSLTLTGAHVGDGNRGRGGVAVNLSALEESGRYDMRVTFAKIIAA